VQVELLSLSFGIRRGSGGMILSPKQYSKAEGSYCSSLQHPSRSCGFRSRIQARALFPSATAHHRPLPLRERARVIAGPVGTGAHSGEDEELRVGASANGGPVLLSGVDGERSSAARELCRCARGYRGARGREGGMTGKDSLASPPEFSSIHFAPVC
jgi:hypothetical protein